MTPATLPYGTWPSPITPAHVAASSGIDACPAADGATAYWLDRRTDPSPHTALVCRTPDGTVADITPVGLDVGSRLHEYGGGAYAVREGIVLVVERATQQVLRIRPAARDGEPGDGLVTPLTPPSDARIRFSALEIDTIRRAVWAIREDLRDPSVEPIDTLVRLDLDTLNADFGEPILPPHHRADFVLDPVLSPDGSRLAWVEWSHPDMAWHGAQVMVGDLDARGVVTRVERVVGGPGAAAFEPVWLSDDELAVLHEAGDFVQPWSVRLGQVPVPLVADDVEYGLPPWVPRLRSMVRMPDGRLAVVRTVDGVQEVVLVGPGR